ncbi:MAG: cyanophycin synthetase [Thermoanaerobaculia bacterium]
MPAILARIAPVLNAEVLLEPEHGFVGWIKFPNGRFSYFWDNKFNLNSVSAVKVAQDKAYTEFFLGTFGYPVPGSRTFVRDSFLPHVHGGRGLGEAITYADELGWPVVAKPCNLSQGRLVAVISSAAELQEWTARIFEKSRVLIVQRWCPGRDFRLIVLDGRVISAYERRPLTVTGDGQCSIEELLRNRQRLFETEGRDTVIDMADARLPATLRRRGLDLASVVPAGIEERLLDVANLSLGGTSHDVLPDLHATFREIAARVATDMDLRFCGVDLIAPSVSTPARDYVVLEVNSAPGLDNYESSGVAHEEKIDALYLEVLRAVAGQ